MISIPNSDDGESGVIILIWILDESESGVMKVKVI